MAADTADHVTSGEGDTEDEPDYPETHSRGESLNRYIYRFSLLTNIFACFRVGLPVAGVGTAEDKLAA